MPLDVVKYLLGRGGKITLFGNQCAREEIKKNHILYVIYFIVIIYNIFYSYHQGQIQTEVLEPKQLLFFTDIGTTLLGIGWRGRWEGGSGWGIHVNLWLIHVNV